MTASIWSKIKKNIETAQREKKKALDKLASARKKYDEKKVQQTKKKALEAHKCEQAVHAESMRLDRINQKRLIEENIEQEKRLGITPLQNNVHTSWGRSKGRDYGGDAWAEFAQSYRDNVSKGRSPVARYKCSNCGAISDYPGCNNCKPTMEQKRSKRTKQIFSSGGEVNTRPYR